MYAHLRAVGPIIFVLAVAAVVPGRALAAPALTSQPADGPVDLAAIHQLIEKAQPGVDFPEGDLTRVKQTLSELLARLDALENLPAGYAKGRTVTTTFERFRTAEVAEKVNLTQKQKVIAVGKEGRMTQSSLSVLLVSGDAEVVQSHDCVVVAGGKVRLVQSSNCVVVAGRSVHMSQCFPRKKEDKGAPAAGAEPAGTVVVAGEGLTCVQSQVGIALVLRPGGAKDAPAIQSIQCRDLLFLNAPADWKSSQDKDCRAEPPKKPLTK
jgi:hypothetical protein